MVLKLAEFDVARVGSSGYALHQYPGLEPRSYPSYGGCAVVVGLKRRWKLNDFVASLCSPERDLREALISLYNTRYMRHCLTYTNQIPFPPTPRLPFGTGLNTAIISLKSHRSYPYSISSSRYAPVCSKAWRRQTHWQSGSTTRRCRRDSQTPSGRGVVRGIALAGGSGGDAFPGRSLVRSCSSGGSSCQECSNAEEIMGPDAEEWRRRGRDAWELCTRRPGGCQCSRQFLGLAYSRSALVRCLPPRCGIERDCWKSGTGCACPANTLSTPISYHRTDSY